MNFESVGLGTKKKREIELEKSTQTTIITYKHYITRRRRRSFSSVSIPSEKKKEFDFFGKDNFTIALDVVSWMYQNKERKNEQVSKATFFRDTKKHYWDFIKFCSDRQNWL